MTLPFSGIATFARGAIPARLPGTHGPSPGLQQEIRP